MGRGAVGVWLEAVPAHSPRRAPTREAQAHGHLLPPPLWRRPLHAGPLRLIAAWGRLGRNPTSDFVSSRRPTVVLEPREECWICPGHVASRVAPSSLLLLSCSVGAAGAGRMAVGVRAGGPPPGPGPCPPSALTAQRHLLPISLAGAHTRSS